MNWYRGPTLTAEPSTVKPESAGKRLRRKLQKIGTRQRWYHCEKVGTSIVTNKTDQAAPETLDIRDGKWLEQLRKGGQLCRGAPSVAQPQNPHRHSMQVIPEFAHLSINEAIPERPLDKRASCATPSSTSSIPRRYAKTPVYRIGQLENWPGQDVERIAESYRALLESSCAILTQQSSPLRPEKPHLTETRNQDSREDTIQEMGSPHSDDGTLVAFEEDATIIKPSSISPGSPSPRDSRRRHEQTQPAPVRGASPAGSPSLQICLDLLGRELSSSLRPSAETSALQVWVMIEAYERLRDQVLGTYLDSDQDLNAMLDTWIKALYAVHDKMTGCDGHVSESEYED
ncbi:hypothetical protein GGR53DRAFT_511326 [Hypoxylon sp. FL1150]|nr:hypothetical protein GGR53DRAFT_511326 [Hypoxylon sp. FL1150]